MNRDGLTCVLKNVVIVADRWDTNTVDVERETNCATMLLIVS